MKSKKITTVGILCALAMILNLFAFIPLVPTVTWLTYDPKDIIIVIGGFIYGPATSLIMSGICSVLEIMIKGGTILDVVMNMISLVLLLVWQLLFININIPNKVL